MAKRIQIRRDTTANWQNVNPILSNGELGIETKTDGKKSIKVGTGSVAWNGLPYILDNPVSMADLQNHINNKSVHGATATPTANLIAMYNANAGLKSTKTPADANDVLRKIELDAFNNDISKLQGDLTSEVNNRISAVSGAVYTASVDASNKSNTAENNAKEYADGLALATQKWLPAVQTFDDLPPNPGSGTYLCRVITGSDYGVYQWIGSEANPSWTFFSDNLDFIDRIVNPITNNLPIITADGELIDGGQSISGILNVISTGLADEAANRITDISGLQDNIDALQTDLDTEINNRTSDVSGLLYNIETVENNLTDETDGRISGIFYLQGEINILASILGYEDADRIADVSGLQYEVDTITQNLTDEINDRLLAVSGVVFDIETLQTDLTDETNNRVADISGLSYTINTFEIDLDTETDNRISGISYLQSEIDGLETDLTTEINDRQSDISGVIYTIETLETGLSDEIINREAAVSGAIYTASVDATNKADTAESNAKQYTDGVVIATQQWLPAVQTTADLPPNPGTLTYLCRVISGDDNGVYQWIGAEAEPEWTYFSDNLDFIDRIANPVTNNIPKITANGELIDSGIGISSIPAPANDAALTLQKNGVQIDTFTANASTDKTINITITKGDVGLANVDNTADADKPISTLTQTALDNKEPLKYVSADETAAQAYSALNPDIMVFYPEE